MRHDLANAIAKILAGRIAADRDVEISDLGLMESPDRASDAGDDGWAAISLGGGWGRKNQSGILIGSGIEDDDRDFGIIVAELTDATDWDGTLVIPAADGFRELTYPLREIRDAAERLVRARRLMRVATPKGDELAAAVKLHAVSHRIVLTEAMRRWLMLRTDAVAWADGDTGLVCEGRRIRVTADGEVAVDGIAHVIAEPITIVPGLVLLADRAIQSEWPWIGIAP